MSDPRVETFFEEMSGVAQVVISSVPKPLDEFTAFFVGFELFPFFQLFGEEQVADRAIAPLLHVILEDGHRLRRILRQLPARRGASRECCRPWACGQYSGYGGHGDESKSATLRHQRLP